MYDSIRATGGQYDRSPQHRGATNWAGLALVVLGAAVEFAGCFYAGLFLFLSLLGIGGAERSQHVLATILPVGLLAGGAAAVIAPSDRNWITVLVTASATALAVAVEVKLIDGDFGIAMGLGGPIVVGVTAVAAAGHGTHSRSRHAGTENVG